MSISNSILLSTLSLGLTFVGALGCADDGTSVFPRVKVSINTAALVDTQLESANGTYGAGCTSRTGAWSAAIAPGATLSHPALSVVKGNVGCDLTLTGLVAAGALHDASPIIEMGASFQPISSSFAIASEPLAFYANAHLGSLTFSADFLVHLLYSDDPHKGVGGMTARFEEGVTGAFEASSVAAPSYAINLAPLLIETNLEEVVQSATGTIDLIDGEVLGQAWVIVASLAPTATYAELDAAFKGAVKTDITGADPQIPAAALTLVGVDLALAPAVRYLIIANIDEDVPSYQLWTLTFSPPAGVVLGPTPVDLGDAGGYVLLTKTGITNVAPTVLTGNVGVSPIASTAMTGFTLEMDVSGTFATSTQVIGRVYAADFAAPTPTVLGDAVTAMEAAFTDAAGRSAPDFVELAAGDLGGQSLAPGLYRWATTVTIPTDVTLVGDINDVWIFQIGTTLGLTADVDVILSGGAQAKNVFWQVGGHTTLAAGSHFEGILLGGTGVTLATGATVNGRVLAQTAVVLQVATITQPAP